METQNRVINDLIQDMSYQMVRDDTTAMFHAVE